MTRDDAVAAWLKRWRDKHDRSDPHQDREDLLWHTLDAMLDEYRLHADTGTPLLEKAEEGPYA